jgi:hypothetical protein
LEQKRIELNIFIDNCALSSETVVKKAREFEELANRSYDIKDAVYWMRRAKRLEILLQEAREYCPDNCKVEIEKVLKL